MTAPAVTSVSPNTGVLAGGQFITIVGTNLGSATGVVFGTGNAATIISNVATQIVAINPAHAAGVVDVLVTTAGGTNTPATADHFTYATGGIVVGPMVRDLCSFTQGYGFQTTDGTAQYDQRLSSAELEVSVTGVADTDAAKAAATSAGYLPVYHPSDSGQIARRITARSFGAGNIILRARYSAKQYPSVITQTGHLSQRWYNDTAGAILPVQPNGQPGYRIYRRTFSIVRFRCNMYQLATPNDYSASVNFINNTTYTIIDGGQTIVTAAQDTLLFAAARRVKVRAGNTAIWMPEFEFHWMPTTTPEGNTGWYYCPLPVGGSAAVPALMYPEAALPNVP